MTKTLADLSCRVCIRSRKHQVLSQVHLAVKEMLQSALQMPRIGRHSQQNLLKMVTLYKSTTGGTGDYFSTIPFNLNVLDHIILRNN